MRYITQLMIYEYNLKNHDMLGYKLTKENATYHHIKPMRHNGQTTVDNGSILSVEAHQTFNELERQYPELAEEINSYMWGYKGYYPLEIWYRIEYLMSLANGNYKSNKKNKKKISNYKKNRKVRKR